MLLLNSYGTQLPPKDLTDKQFDFNPVHNVSVYHGLYQIYQRKPMKGTVIRSGNMNNNEYEKLNVVDEGRNAK